MTWHVDATLLAGYVEGRLAETPASSVEAHLLHCAECRGALARSAGPGRRAVHERTWVALAEEVDVPTVGPIGLVLGRLMPSHLVRLLSVASAMRLAWWGSGTAVLTLALLMSHLERGSVGTALFVVTAPLVPLAGVAVAYSQRTDVAGEVVTTTPYPRFRLLLLRTGAVAAVTLPVVGLLAAALPVDARLATLWVAPTLALTTLSLLLAGVVDARKSAAGLGLLWLVAAWAALRPSRAPLPVDELLQRAAVFRPAGQAVLLAVAVLALLVAAILRTRHEEGLRA
jgi:hypothetical protein